MKIEKKPQRTLSELPSGCHELINNLKDCDEEELQKQLRSLTSWNYGKCELYHWIDVLNRFDEVLERAWKTEGSEEDECVNLCVGVTDHKTKELVVSVLKFSALLIEHSYARHVYNSMESLVTLLGSTDMDVIIAVLNLLYVFSKRSNFLARLSSDQRHSLQLRLNHLAESWGGKENGFGLAQCCADRAIMEFPETATTLHAEFYHETTDASQTTPTSLCTIHLEHLDQLVESPSEIVRYLVAQYRVPKGKQMSLLSRVRLAKYFPTFTTRVQCVQSRLQAIAVLVYSNAGADVVTPLLYPGFTEELVELLQLNDSRLVEVRAAALRTLTAIIHLERSPKLSNIIDATGAANYHGFLPTVARNCVTAMTDANVETFPLNFSTALFSFVYHLASLEAGAGALLSCGILETLLKVIDFRQQDQSHLTFVTRAVRIIDLITNLEMGALQAQNGLESLIARLQYDMDECRKSQPFELPSTSVGSSTNDQEPAAMETETAPSEPTEDAQHIEEQPPHEEQQETQSEPEQIQHPEQEIDERQEEKLDEQEGMETDEQAEAEEEGGTEQGAGSSQSAVSSVKHTCLPQRAALVKSILNFLKKCIPDPAFAESIRTMMDGSLPSSLKHIISNSEFYGSALYYLATEVVTVYVFHEPSLLSALQDTGLTGVMLNSLIMKDIPATRDVLGSLPNMLSALCLNARGLEAFVNCKPFDRLFKVMLLPEYLPAMRRRRSTDDLDDTATNLGSAMDELMRHQPTLKSDAMAGVVRLLQQLCEMGRDPQCTVETRNEASRTENIEQPSRGHGEGQGTLGATTDDEDDDDIVRDAVNSQRASPQPEAETFESSQKKAVPLLDYAHNVVRFLFSILNNNATDDHYREFVQQKGLDPLLEIPSLPNMPITFPISPACQSIAVTCRGLLSVAVQPEVLTQCIQRLTDILLRLNDAWSGHHTNGSVLLHELACSSNPAVALESAQMSPLLHCMVSAHSYINILSVLCKVTQSDIKTLMINQWASRAGLALLGHFSTLCRSLIWECTVLLALCTPGHIPEESDFGMDDLRKLVPEFDRRTACVLSDLSDTKEAAGEDTAAEASSSSLTPAAGAVLEQLIELESEATGSPVGPVKCDETSGLGDKMAKLSPQLTTIIKYIRPLLTVASRLGRSVSDIYAVLVRLFIIPQHQPRRYRQPPSPPKQPAWECVAALTKALVDGFTWLPPDLTPTPGFRLTLLLCFAGLTSSMLFDEQKSPYHIMLSQFTSLGGVDALLEAFNWAVDAGRAASVDSSRKASLYEDAGEFVDMWLFLMERMVNVNAILDSPHSLLSSWKPPKKFDPLAFLVKTHKVAFSAVSTLWCQKPVREVGQMSEASLQILSHIIQGESQIREKLEKQTGGGETADRSSSAAQPDVNESYLQMLSDMGFPESHCREALINTSNNWERAVEYVLSHPPADFDADLLGSMGVEMSEEEQMARAIALSLGDNSTTEETHAKETKQPEVEQTEDETSYMEKSVLDDFTDQLLGGCLQLLDHVPRAVHGVCDLITIAAKRSGKEWKKRVLADLYKELSAGVVKLVESGQSCVRKLSSESDQNVLKEFTEGDFVTGLVTRLHLFALLFEESKLLCVQDFEMSDFISQLVELVSLTATCLSKKKDTPTPKWLCFVLLILDLYQSVSSPYYSRLTGRKKVARMWQWFDDRGHRWYNYTQANNAGLNDVYNKDEPVARITAGRRRYVIDFRTMMQTNEDTGNVRPVMFVEMPAAESSQEEQPATTSEVITPSDEPGSSRDDKDLPKAKEAQESDNRPICGLSEEQQVLLIRSAAQLIGVPVNSELLNAVLRLCLRLTRFHTCAAIFTEHDGPKHILNLKQPSAFSGFSSLVTLIFRHILEDKLMLERTMESVVRSVALPGVGASRELYSAFRKLGPAACRDPGLFTQVAMRLLRIAPATKRQEEASSLPGRSQPAIHLKALPAPKKSVGRLTEMQEAAVKQLLDALCSASDETQSDTTEQKKETVNPRDLQRQMTDGMDEQEMEEEMDVQAETQPQQSGQERKANDTTSKPLLSKASILKILAELVRCYPGCARLVAEYNGEDSGDSESVLAYILDHLLTMPAAQVEAATEVPTAGSSDTASLARILLVTVSAVQHSPDAHTSLVNEVKAAFQRALLMPECPTKHSRIQALAGLLNGMIEPSPPMGGAPTMMNVHKLLLRKGLLSDLARISHSLDLSSPSMANTINAVLKTLESLTFLVNSYTQKTLLPGDKKGEKKTSAGEQPSGGGAEVRTETGEDERREQPAVGQIHVAASEARQEIVVLSTQASQLTGEASSQRLHEEEHFADLSTLASTYDADMEDARATQDWDMSEVAATPQPQDRDDNDSMSDDEADEAADEVAEIEAVVGELLEGGDRDAHQGHFVVEEPTSDEEESGDDHEGSGSDGSEESHSSEVTLSGDESEGESQDEQEEDVISSPLSTARENERETTELVLTVETMTEHGDQHSDRGEDYDVHIVTEIIDSPRTGDLEDAIRDVEDEADHLNETMEAVDEEDEDIGEDIEEDEDDEDDDDDDDLGEDDEEGSEMEGDEEQIDETIYDGDMNLMDDDIPHPLEEMLMLVADRAYDGRPPGQQLRPSVYTSYDRDLFEVIGLAGPPAESVPQQHPLLTRSGASSQHSAAQLQQLRTLAGYPLPRTGTRHRGQLRRVSQQVNTLTQPSELGMGHAQPHAQTRRLLGPAVAQRLFQLNQRGVTGRAGTHVTRTTPHVQVIPRAGILPDTEHMYIAHPRGPRFLNPFEFGPPRLPASRSTIPSSLSRWTEESRLLDGEIAYGCLESCQRKVLDVLNVYRKEEKQQEDQQRKEKEEQAVKEAKEKEQKEKEKQAETSGTGASSQAMETEQSSSETGNTVESSSGDMVTPQQTTATENAGQVTADGEQQDIVGAEPVHHSALRLEPVSSSQAQQDPQEVEEDSRQVEEMEQEQSAEVQPEVEQEQAVVQQLETVAQSGTDEQTQGDQEMHDESSDRPEEPEEFSTGDHAQVEQQEQVQISGPAEFVERQNVDDVQGSHSQAHSGEMNVEVVSNQGESAEQDTLPTDASELEQHSVTAVAGQVQEESGDFVGETQTPGSQPAPDTSPVNGLSESVAALRPYSIAGEPVPVSFANVSELGILPAVSEAAAAVAQSMAEFVAVAQGEASVQSTEQPATSQSQSLPSTSAPSEETLANISSRLHARRANHPGGVEVENMSIFLSALQSLTPGLSSTSQPSSTAVTSIQPAESIDSQASNLAASLMAAMSHGPTSLGQPLEQALDSVLAHARDAQLSHAGAEVQVPSVPPESSSEHDQRAVSEELQSRGSSHDDVGTGSAGATATAESSGLEGVDPSFLAALPEDLREEVVADQLRMRRARQAAESRVAGTSNQQALPVSPEVLAALPPNLQEEVIQQQRMMQARQAMRDRAPEMTSDPTAFLQNLPASLRQSLLAEMDDDTLSQLPSEITSEARQLRTQRDARHAQILHEQFLAAAGGVPASWSSFLRSSGLRRAGAFRHHVEGYRPLHRPFMPIYGQVGSSSKPTVTTAERKENEALGKQLLDREALTCLLVLLFIDEPKVHMSQLQRVIKNLCQHKETRAWIVSTLLSILTRTATEQLTPACHPQTLPVSTVSADTTSTEVRRSITEMKGLSASQSGMLTEDNPKVSGRKAGSWLSLKVDATLGLKANVFQMDKSGKGGVGTRINVHPHAVPIVCRHVLDQLYCLVKFMPKSFMPPALVRRANESEALADDVPELVPAESDFWDILVRLDGAGGSRKGKAAVRASTKPVTESHLIDSGTEFGSSPFGHLISMLSHPVVRRSQTLTDHLLKLLSTLSRNIPDCSAANAQKTQSAASDVVNSSSSQEQNQSMEPQRMEQIPEQEGNVTSGTQASTEGAEGGGTTSSTAKAEGKDTSGDDNQSSPVPLLVDPSLTSLVVDVLTAGLCSEEGLEDATVLLLQLSRQGSENRENGLDLMLRGTKELGLRVCQQVDCLLLQLQDYRKENPDKFKQVDETDGSSSSTVSAAEQRRTMQDAALASLNRTSKSTKKHMDLHLPAMGALTCKASTQTTFLRALKVVLQLRDSARQAAKPSGRSMSQLTSQMEQQRERLEELRETLEDVRRARGSSQRSSIHHLEQVQQALEDLEAEAGTLASSLQGINMMLDIGTREEQPPPQAEESSSSSTMAQEAKNAASDEENVFTLPSLSHLLDLDALWEKLSHCLIALADSTDSHAVLVLQPTVEAFFLVHGSEKGQTAQQTGQEKPHERSLSHHRLLSSDYSNPNSPALALPLSPSQHSLPRSDSKTNVSDLSPDMAKFLLFAETHRTVLNQILRQSTTALSDGPFNVLIDHTRLLDFDVKRRYFRHELERMDSGVRRDDMVIHVRRENVFEDSFRELHRRRPEEMKNRMYVVFEGEDGQDAGGLLREWFLIMSREMFNPNYALFRTTPGDRVTYIPNSMSHCNTNHLSYFKFIGRIIAKAIYDNKLLECYFSRSFYKHILGKPVHYTDLEAEDYSFYQGLVYLLEHDLNEMGTELTFSTEVEEFGVCEIRDLKENGHTVQVTEENKREYVHLVCQMKMTGSIRAQIKAFLDGFYEIIPKRLISIFNEQEMELLISGLPTVDIEDLKANTEYHKYNNNSLQIQWLWRALRSFDQADRAKFLQFVTGTSKVPLQGFGALEGMNGPQKFQIHRDDRSTSRLPSAHTCFNQLDLPAYETYEKLRFQLQRVIQECPEGFGLV